MIFDLSSDDLSCINNALVAKVDHLHHCYLVNVNSRPDYAASLKLCEDRYRVLYKKLNGGLDIIF